MVMVCMVDFFKSQKVKKSKSQREEESMVNGQRSERRGRWRSLPHPLPKGKGFDAAMRDGGEGLNKV